MTTITIPKKVTRGKELVIIPREDYERFLRFQELAKKRGAVQFAIEEGLCDLRAGRMTPVFSSVKEFKRYLKKRK